MRLVALKLVSPTQPVWRVSLLNFFSAFLPAYERCLWNDKYMYTHTSRLWSCTRYFPAIATLFHRCFRDISCIAVSRTDKCVHLRPCAATASSAPLYYANLPLSAVSGWFQTFSRAT